MDRPVIVLDVNETLSDLSALTPAFEAEGAAGALAQTWFAATLRDGFALTMVGESRSFAEVGRPVLLGLLAHVEGLLDEPADAADAILRAFAELPPHDDVAAGITALAAAGHRIVTLSNGAGANARALVERAGVADLVERHLGVEDTGVMKPHPDAYRRGLASLGVEPGDAVLAAVHPWDLHGARRAGLRTAFVDRTGAPWPAVFERAEFAVPSLVELAGVIHM
ncbi:haloacid dehalogenase type II [Curtobacterium sp. MCBD17_040]|uniref:haloacid dehalogenase type II n=1 Tax=Curtobacterium sp. MCBD17_040 TaxID=2175674 RepID=UPI000DA9F59C|nr:haloacid dehalogenase type II [Curtobacterium sp. MCBD17_040]WIB64179.1 haloacid dehalogenase type II [Curtobacterium sp. MCBD17_040]